MDLSHEMQDVLTMMKVLDKESGESIARNCNESTTRLDFRSDLILGDIINTSKMNFSDDETWLYESPIKNSDVKDLKAWLYQDIFDLKDYDFHSNHLALVREITNIETKKSIDSRTFTRPKRRLNRPSIELYNEGYFKMDRSVLLDSNKYKSETECEAPALKCEKVENFQRSVDIALSENNEIPENDATTIPQAPLNFDFSQPTTSSIFDKIVADAPDVDSFQNMSPPSLVNSMCSSTFTNLMENSMIKNDPVLREIRDTDYTDDMLQDCEPPMFKSFTDSCSSINSDTPEGFLKRTANTTFNKIYKKNISNEKENTLNETYRADNTVVLNCTYEKNSSSDISSTEVSPNPGILTQPTTPRPKEKHADANITITNPEPILNGTYRKKVNTKLDNTFEKSPKYSSNDDLNRTITISDNVDSNRLNLTKRHSYIIDNRTCDLNQTTNLKRNSVGFSAGSTDSLDYMSSLSSSSKGSNKMLNMAEVDAIVLQQEQSLQQVMSTPKPSSKIISKLWENNFISPISTMDRGDHLSDSEGSSNDDYRTVSSSTSSMRTPFGSDTQVVQANKSLEDFIPKNEMPKANPRSLNVITTKTVGSKKLDSNYSGSYSNLRTMGANLKGSYTSLRPPSSISSYNKGSYSNLSSTTNSIKGSYTNLKTMSNNLKGSYTQLKPVLKNLPYTDTNLKVYNPNPTMITKQRINPPPLKVSSNTVKIAEVAPTLRNPIVRDQIKSTSAINKPQSKASGLPRPVSAIPRPMTSRIPGPRSARQAFPRTSSKLSMDCDF